MKNWLHISGAIFLLLAFFCQPAGMVPVVAQAEARIKINHLDASGFPTIRLEADVLKPDGSFISDLKPEDFKVIENGQMRPVDEVQETPNAVDFIVAVNGGPILGNRISSKTNLQLIKDALMDWVPEAQSIGKGDSVTLVTNAGVKAVRLDSPEKWISAFNSISTELVNATPSLTSLTKAVEQATGAPTRPGMKQTILYITPLMSSGMAKAIGNVADQAAGAGIKINIWLVAPASAKQPEAEKSIQSLADRTGGEVYRFSGKEALPPIETYLQPLRRQYEIMYRSRSNKSGIQVIALEIQTDKLQVRSTDENVTVDIKAPNVMFVNPPEGAALQWKTDKNGRASLEPPEIPLQIHIEFPDNHPRNLLFSRLMVNDLVVDERNGAPFDQLKWPVTRLKTSGSYNLQVIIKDELGFTSKTVVLPLDVEVPIPPAVNFLESISSERLALAIGVILLVAGGGLFLQFRLKKGREKPALKPAAAKIDTHPVERTSVVTNLSDNKTVPSISASLRDSTGWLFPVAGGDTITTQPSIRLNEPVVTLGSSPIRASVVIPSPSVDGLHVRIIHKMDGYWLEDAGSVSGTWVNGTPVSNLGTELHPGDTIRLGKVSFRFELRG
ncbi:FHA domain-containing protein [Leptolinea tardivitalis]|uniref:FHA domain-containing protein n=1 Tax=Leptolinea tardivitalis TaxID=229920 RepID=UPI0007858265|nr:FHA domain-containing protein [Leptolinea tardivitalis]GAP22083.1 protein containing FOG: FHA domain [Leptolinea tardivitalis]